MIVQVLTFIRLLLHWWHPNLVLLCDLLVAIGVWREAESYTVNTVIGLLTQETTVSVRTANGCRRVEVASGVVKTMRLPSTLLKHTKQEC